MGNTHSSAVNNVHNVLLTTKRFLAKGGKLSLINLSEICLKCHAGKFQKELLYGVCWDKSNEQLREDAEAICKARLDRNSWTEYLRKTSPKPEKPAQEEPKVEEPTVPEPVKVEEPRMLDLFSTPEYKRAMIDDAIGVLKNTLYSIYGC